VRACVRACVRGRRYLAAYLELEALLSDAVCARTLTIPYIPSRYPACMHPRPLSPGLQYLLTVAIQPMAAADLTGVCMIHGVAITPTLRQGDMAGCFAVAAAAAAQSPSVHYSNPWQRPDHIYPGLEASSTHTCHTSTHT
jgi:hypothetical protein